MKTIKIKIEKLEKINDGILYIYYRATNVETSESRKTNSESYYGSDIINLSTMTEEQLNNLPTIYGKKYSDEIIVSEETRQYSEANAETEIENEGWNEEIEKAIKYVIY